GVGVLVASGGPAGAVGGGTFTASLTGAQEVPPNASTATGTATVTLNAAETMITVSLTFSGLTAPATAAHIHGLAPPGTNAPVVFPLAGVPLATSGSIGPQVFAITAGQVSGLRSGLFYVNVHDSTFPGGEIRGQLTEVVGLPPATGTTLFSS